MASSAEVHQGTRSPTQPRRHPLLAQGCSRHHFFFGIFSFLTNSENSRAGNPCLVSTSAFCTRLLPSDPSAGEARPFLRALSLEGLTPSLPKPRV